MTGKLDIGQGTNYGAYWRLAKAHAEHVAHHSGTGSTDLHPGAVKVDGSAIPASGANGDLWKLKFKTSGNDQTTGVVDGNASRADVLTGLINQLKQLESNGLIGHSSTDGTDIYLKPGILGPITDAVIEKAAASTNPPPPPQDFVEGPFTAMDKEYWLQRENGDWYLWVDATPADGAPDTRIPLAVYLEDSSHDDYAAIVLSKAQGLGYGG